MDIPGRYPFLNINIIFIGILFLFPFPSLAQDISTTESNGSYSFTYGGEIDFNSQYIWRGIEASQGPVLQPSVWVTINDFEMSIWGNYVLSKGPNEGKFDEIDLILTYTHQWGDLSLEPSIEYWFYPNQEDTPDTGEIALQLSYPIGPVEIYTKQHLDFIKYEGAYFGLAGITHEYEWNEKLTLEGNLGIGWGSGEFNETYFEIHKNALNLIYTELTLTYEPGNSLYFRPHIGISHIVDNELNDLVDHPTLLYGGLIIGIEF